MSNVQGWHRRAAIQLAAQLPEDIEDALTVLKLTNDLVRQFLADGSQRQPAVLSADLVTFPASSSSRCNANGSASTFPKYNQSKETPGIF